jgi:Ribosomal proteins 50S-L15, 50S-L18e, 60S-L27A
VLGHGDVTQKLFIAADKFSDSARSKIEAAGGFVQVMAPEKATDTGKPGKGGKGGAKADQRGDADLAASPDSADAAASDETAAEAPDPQPDVDASEAPESEGSATQAVDVDASSEADAEEPAEEPADDAKPARRRSSKTTSEE